VWCPRQPGAVDEDDVRASAQVLVDSGLAARGWSTINIDDGWQGDLSAHAAAVLWAG